jgi:hypothetical protein
MLVLIVGSGIIACNNGSSISTGGVDTSKMNTVDTSRMNTDTLNKMKTDTSKMAPDTSNKKY